MELEFKSRLLNRINLDHSITFCTLSQRMLNELSVPRKYQRMDLHKVGLWLLEKIKLCKQLRKS